MSVGAARPSDVAEEVDGPDEPAPAADRRSADPFRHPDSAASLTCPEPVRIAAQRQ